MKRDSISQEQQRLLSLSSQVDGFAASNADVGLLTRESRRDRQMRPAERKDEDIGMI